MQVERNSSNQKARIYLPRYTCTASWVWFAFSPLLLSFSGYLDEYRKQKLLQLSLLLR